MHEAWAIALNVLGVLGVLATGLGARRVGWLTAEADRSIARLLVNVALPCLFFSRLVGQPPQGTFAGVAVPPVVGFGTTVFGFAVAGLVAAAFAGPLRLGDARQRRAFTFTTGIYNYGYLPLPIAAAFFGDRVVSTLIVHNVGVEIALWSVGLLVIRGAIGRDAWRQVLSPPVVAIGVALLVDGVGLAPYVPTPLLRAADLIGPAAVPLGLILSGATMFDLWREGDWLANWPMVAATSALRLALLPLAFLLLAKYGGLPIELRKVVVLQAAMPAGILPLVLTRLYGQDTRTAFRVVVGTTVLGIVTIPAWLAFGCWWLGLTFG